MNRVNTTATLLEHQEMIIKAQKLALKVSGTGINVDPLPTLSLEELAGTINCLRHLHVEKAG